MLEPEEQKIDTLKAEDDREIVEPLRGVLDDNELAICMIGTHNPVRVAPGEDRMVKIGYEEEEDIQELLSNRVTAEDYDRLFLVIHSHGGAVKSSYKVARRIRNEFEEIVVFVPHLALSGGTLITLTGNEVVMGEMSNLSAIDIQVPYKEGQRSVNSMLRLFGTLEEYFKKVSKKEAPYTRISLADDIDPVVFQEWIDTARLMQLYSTEILSHNRAEFTQGEAEKLIEILSSGLPVHEYAVMGDEFQEWVNQVKNIDYIRKPDEYPQLWQIANKWKDKYVECNADSHVFRFVEPARVDYEKLVERNMDEIKEIVKENELDIETIIEKEKENKDREQLINWLQEQNNR